FRGAVSGCSFGLVSGPGQRGCGAGDFHGLVTQLVELAPPARPVGLGQASEVDPRHLVVVGGDPGPDTTTTDHQTQYQPAYHHHRGHADPDLRGIVGDLDVDELLGAVEADLRAVGQDRGFARLEIDACLPLHGARLDE